LLPVSQMMTLSLSNYIFSLRGEHNYYRPSLLF
jgi:hypothetical protein